MADWLTLFFVPVCLLYQVSATPELTVNSLLYQVRDAKSEALRPEIKLLTQDETLVSRARRYVPDSRPLDEYLDHNKFIAQPEQDESLPPISRQTKEVKFSDKMLVPQTGIIDNTSARGARTTTTQTPTSTTSTTTSTASSLPPASPNRPVIIAAEFENAPAVKPAEEDDDEDLPVSKDSEQLVNNTMKQNNITEKRLDSHMYYNSTFLVDEQVGQSYWVDMSKRNDVKINDMLSKSHRRAATVKLTFDFPFYGHMVRNVTIATGGFLYTGEYVHSWLAATQYIAPLMANFDTSINNHSLIKYLDNGTAFTVQWEKVVLQDKPTYGEFTFQVTLHDNGDIVFVYQNIPVIIERIMDDHHPVKVGLSDAYIFDKVIFLVRRKTIYEYHRVNFKKEDIKNWTVIYLSALPTCMQMKTCNSCLSADIGFECKWCPDVGRCSSGMDRHRQEWMTFACDTHYAHLTSPAQCDQLRPAQQPSASAAAAASPNADMGENVHSGRSGYIGAAFIVVLIAGVVIWAWYAYSNPHSTSGQILIKYRPSQWSWRRGEARYTAATIHM